MNGSDYARFAAQKVSYNQLDDKRKARLTRYPFHEGGRVNILLIGGGPIFAN